LVAQRLRLVAVPFAALLWTHGSSLRTAALRFLLWRARVLMGDSMRVRQLRRALLL
jgi:hypothetical protein